ncbi:MbcA/ParS/Xre antitoxin family protein [Roseomonas sp. KE2513]|uniref:MbcA/ParS/Xre antitoxin family protein n=1 Tax=Roseomonas sp. KE2513 TaxID=2479202 RepID=UPI0018DF557E|nr:MbcA/ParS/Xre antitoxin family protein [Roseomonas sp. KE2513]
MGLNVLKQAAECLGQLVREACGFLEAIIETGTERVIWSFRDPSLPSHEGLHLLENGDELRVLDDAGGTLWEGVVRFERLAFPLTSRPDGDLYGEDALGMWFHGTQKGVDPETWRCLFAQRRRAVLRPGPRSSRQGKLHPFSGPVDGLRARLAALPQQRAEELFEGALRQWLGSGAGAAWRGLAYGWGLDPAEVVMVLNYPVTGADSPSATIPERGGETLLPFYFPVFERLGLLFALNAALLCGLPNAASRASWLSSGNARLAGLHPTYLLRGSEMEGVRPVLDAARADLGVEEAAGPPSDEERRHLAFVEELDAARRQNAARVLPYVERLAGTLPALAAEVLGSRNAATEWFMQPALAFCEKRPIDMLGTAAGRERVDLLLKRRRPSVYG